MMLMLLKVEDRQEAAQKGKHDPQGHGKQP